MRSSFSTILLLYHLLSIWNFLILTCTIYILAPYCLNPKEVKNYKKSFNDIGKNDGIDSYVIADFARVGRIAIKPWRGSQYLALQRLTRHRMHITECIASFACVTQNSLRNFCLLANLMGIPLPIPSASAHLFNVLSWLL